MGNLHQFLLSSNHSVIDGMKYFSDLYRKICTGKEFAMASPAGLSETILYDTLVNYLISMARTVESAMNRALEAIVSVDDPQVSALVGELFLLDPRINEMEIVIDEHAIRLLRRGGLRHADVRFIRAVLS